MGNIHRNFKGLEKGEMMKPKKKEHKNNYKYCGNFGINELTTIAFNCGVSLYNQAIDEYEKHLPSEEEILQIIYGLYPPYEFFPFPNNTEAERKSKSQQDRIKKEMLAKAIYKRITNG